MGRSVYLTEKEEQALIDTCTEWEGMMSDGAEGTPITERLNEGLGSAMKKLYRYRNCRAYDGYTSK